MFRINKLNNTHIELYKEFLEFIKYNNIDYNDVLLKDFIYTDKSHNKYCFNYNNNLTYEECCMYNLTVNNLGEWIIVDNDVGAIYILLKNNIVIGFRFAYACMKNKNDRELIQCIVNKNNLCDEHYNLLKEHNYFNDN